jgi:hypothetical protein
VVEAQLGGCRSVLQALRLLILRKRASAPLWSSRSKRAQFGEGGDGTGAEAASRRAPGGDRPEWSAFTDMTRGLSLRLADWPAEIEAVRRWYEPHLERIHDDAPARKADLMQLEQIAASYASREPHRVDP